MRWITSPEVFPLQALQPQGAPVPWGEINQSKFMGEKMEKLLNQIITVFCARYIYTGKLIKIEDEYITLERPSIVYETGNFDSEKWADAQLLPQPTWNIIRISIESFGILK
jgi:hypothetical protein